MTAGGTVHTYGVTLPAPQQEHLEQAGQGLAHARDEEHPDRGGLEDFLLHLSSIFPHIL